MNSKQKTEKQQKKMEKDKMAPYICPVYSKAPEAWDPYLIWKDVFAVALYLYTYL